MKEPKIVYCDNNHIYDAAIYSVCPYCQKIKEQANMRFMDGNKSSESDENDELTELIKTEDDGLTELMDRKEAREELKPDPVPEAAIEGRSIPVSTTQKEPEKDNRSVTVAGYAPVNAVSTDDIGNVVGLLIITSGNGKGHSIEVCEKSRFLYMDGDRITTGFFEECPETALANIWWDDAVFLSPCNGQELMINNKLKTKDTILQSYDTITIGDYQLVYVQLLTRFLGWHQ